MEFELQDIKKLRAVLGMRQSELARLAGVSQSLIAKIESGKADPAFSKVKRVMEVLENAKNTAEAHAGDVMNRNVIFVSKKTRVLEAVKLIKEKGISQLPVCKGKAIVGAVCEENVLEGLQKFGHEKMERLCVGEIMGEPFLCVREDTPCKTIAQMLKREKAVLVSKNGKTLGIITKVDLL
ncbi:hypothetical protein AUJ17_00540 [Candidatus Micrarchaeota archaeon CG1_02_47_40]|nr:MAG: hypothetical protein AUJ17_00540 [Candidatus Micrarchaeota archaeon CG1_02_47_40]